MCKGRIRQAQRSDAEGRLMKHLEEAMVDMRRSRSSKVKDVVASWDEVFKFIQKDRDTKKFFDDLFSGDKKLAIRRKRK
jgi:hypothetical protein